MSRHNFDVLAVMSVVIRLTMSHKLHIVLSIIEFN